MHVKTRNSIILGSTWLAMTAALFFWQLRQYKELDQLDKINIELAHLSSLILDVDSLTVRAAEVKQAYDSRDKEIPLNDQLPGTYSSIIAGLDQAGHMKLGIDVAGRQSAPDWGYARYILKDGEGQFSNIYRFIHYLENGKNLQKIYALQLVQVENPGPDSKSVTRTIRFQMELHACYSKYADLATSPTAAALPVTLPRFNPFSPQFARVEVKEILPADVIPKEVEVRLIIAGKALVKFRNAVIALRVGDMVKGGYVVSNIDAELGVVDFTLEEGGQTRRVEKSIQFEKKK